MESLLEELIKALKAQTEAINALAASNHLLIQSMLETEGAEPERSTYLDGRPKS